MPLEFKNFSFLTTFKQLGLSTDVLKVLPELGFENPTTIQKDAIPLLLEGERDFIGLAQTGTGKTAAFGIPLLEHVDPFESYTQALVLAPTRELGQQIAEHLKEYGKYLDHVNILAVYGGAAISTQIKALRKPRHIIIATPGRLIDLIKRKAVKLNLLRFLVLDEADEMLNMGFKDELDRILSYTPEHKITWLFSATMPHEIKRMVRTYMTQPLEVKAKAISEVNANIEHQYTLVSQGNKTKALTRFIDINPDLRGIIFCRTKMDTRNLTEELLKLNYQADAIHGDLSQSQRDRVMKRFKAHELRLLVATDVAARGIHVNDLTHIFHFTLPDELAYYTHRSGRTARAGKTGISIAFISGKDQHKIHRIENKLSISFKKILVPEVSDVAGLNIENWCRNILEKRTRGKIDPNLLEKVNILFGNLSKEELIAKVVMNELERLNLDHAKDLNDSERNPKSSRRDFSNKRRRPFSKSGRRSHRGRKSRRKKR